MSESLRDRVARVLYDVDPFIPSSPSHSTTSAEHKGNDHD